MHPLLSPEAKLILPEKRKGKRVELPKREPLSKETSNRLLRAQLDARCVVRAERTQWQTVLWFSLILGALLLYGAFV
jgi:hypothetical protein